MKLPIVTPEIDSYLLEMENRVPRSATLREMESLAAENRFPIIGPLVGRAMSTIATAIQAKRVFELGSGFGYSAIWFAHAIGKSGQIICTDGDSKNEEKASGYFNAAEVETPIVFHVGDALTISRQYHDKYDIVFCDIDKHEYPDAIEEAYRLLRPGGIFFTDNTLWSGRILSNEPSDKNTEGVRQFNQMLFDDRRFVTTILPIRDGVSMAVRC